MFMIFDYVMQYVYGTINRALMMKNSAFVVVNLVKNHLCQNFK
jgi:hypothetical protein